MTKTKTAPMTATILLSIALALLVASLVTAAIAHARPATPSDPFQSIQSPLPTLTFSVPENDFLYVIKTTPTPARAIFCPRITRFVSLPDISVMSNETEESRP